MKLKSLIIVSILAVFTVACRNKSDLRGQSPTSSPTAQIQTSNQSGIFQTGEHPTTGNVRVITEQGTRYLEFDQNFKTVKGPDLFVILYKDSTVPIYGIKDKDYAQIARLQKLSGVQRYVIPNNVKLADYKSVAVWCHQFNATFGYAPLKV